MSKYQLVSNGNELSAERDVLYLLFFICSCQARYFYGGGYTGGGRLPFRVY